MFSTLIHVNSTCSNPEQLIYCIITPYYLLFNLSTLIPPILKKTATLTYKLFGGTVPPLTHQKIIGIDEKFKKLSYFHNFHNTRNPHQKIIGIDEKFKKLSYFHNTRNPIRKIDYKLSERCIYKIFVEKNNTKNLNFLWLKSLG